MLRRTRPPIVLIVSCLLLLGCAHDPEGRANRVYQTSTIPALLEGVYDGDLTLAELREHGDFGLGTFDAVDGEMVLLDGRCYQIRADGKAYRPPMEMKTPLAVVTAFRSDRSGSVQGPMSYEDLQRRLDGLRRSNNVPCAIRLDGEFELVRTRSVPRQMSPYRRLAEVTKEQSTFEFQQVRGTIVAFWFPGYAKGLNVPGYHLHFLTADRSAGGHVLECRPGRVRVQLAEMNELIVRLPQNAAFRTAALDADRQADLHAVEQAPTSDGDRRR